MRFLFGHKYTGSTKSDDVLEWRSRSSYRRHGVGGTVGDWRGGRYMAFSSEFKIKCDIVLGIMLAKLDKDAG